MSHTPHSSARQRHQARLRQLPVETASLTLRAFVPEDAPKVFQMSQEEGMRTWLPSQVYRDEAHAASVLASLISQYSVPGDPSIGPYVLGVQVRSAGELVGHVGFGPSGEAVEVGFAIESVHQRKGIATEAVRAACEWAADSFSIATILGITAAQNSASQGVLLRAGFARQREDVMHFQGLEQPVIFFAFARRH
jgi:ribosomal-protein-alanine N-acetyltransferase